MFKTIIAFEIIVILRNRHFEKMAMHHVPLNRTTFSAPWHKENGDKKYGMEEEEFYFQAFSYKKNNVISDQENDHHEI